MVEGTGLENRRTGNGTVSSNLTLSVKKQSASCIVPFASRVWAGYGTQFVLANTAMQDAGCCFRDGWPSGLRRTPGKCVYVHSVPWVRIPPRPLEAMTPQRLALPDLLVLRSDDEEFTVVPYSSWLFIQWPEHAPLLSESA